MLLNVACRAGETHEQERVRCDAKTFEEWENKAEAYYSVCTSRGGSSRDCYDMNGQSVFHETYSPWSVLLPTTERAFPSDFKVTRESPVIKLAEKTGGTWDEGYYADPSYGWPVWRGEDCMRKVFEFLQEYTKLKKEM